MSLESVSALEDVIGDLIKLLSIAAVETFKLLNENRSQEFWSTETFTRPKQPTICMERVQIINFSESP